MSIIMSFLGGDGCVFVNLKDSCAHAQYNYELIKYKNCGKSNWKWGWLTSGPIDGAQYTFHKN